MVHTHLQPGEESLTGGCRSWESPQRCRKLSVPPQCSLFSSSGQEKPSWGHSVVWTYHCPACRTSTPGRLQCPQNYFIIIYFRGCLPQTSLLLSHWDGASPLRHCTSPTLKHLTRYSDYRLEVDIQIIEMITIDHMDLHCTCLHISLLFLSTQHSLYTASHLFFFILLSQCFKYFFFSLFYFALELRCCCIYADCMWQINICSFQEFRITVPRLQASMHHMLYAVSNSLIALSNNSNLNINIKGTVELGVKYNTSNISIAAGRL